MILCREQIVFFEELAKQQVQIWNDSADVGVHLTDENRAAVRDNIMALQEWAYRIYKWDARIQWSRTYRIPVEYEGTTHISGYIIHLDYFKGRGVEFISVNIHRGTWRA